MNNSRENSQLASWLSENYKSLANRSRDIIYHYSIPSGQFLFFNKIGLDVYGFGTKKSVLLLIHPDDREQVRRASRESLHAGCTKGEVEYRICLKDGSIRWMHDKWTVMRDEHGTPLAMEGIIRDNTDKKLIERELRERERELAIKARNLEDLNAALKVLLRRREEDQREIEQRIIDNVKELLGPYLMQLKGCSSNERQSALVDILEANLKEIISPFLRKISLHHINLTPAEIQVANFVKQGRTSKEIANLLRLSPKTVENHRNRIRQKLKIHNRKINLRSALLSYQDETSPSDLFPIF